MFIESDGETACYLADVCPTSAHLPLPWIMGYDLEPLKTLETKKRVLPEAIRDGWTVVFEHDRVLPLATLVERDGKVLAQNVELE